MIEPATRNTPETPSSETNARRCESGAAPHMKHNQSSRWPTISMSRPRWKTLRPEALKVLVSLSMLLNQTGAGPLGSSSHYTNLNLLPDHEQATKGAKFRIIEAGHQLVPNDQRLALKIVISDEEEEDEQQLHRKADSMRQSAFLQAHQREENRRNSTKRAPLRRPYDLSEGLNNFSFNERAEGDVSSKPPTNRHYYSVDNSSQSLSATGPVDGLLSRTSPGPDERKTTPAPPYTSTTGTPQQATKRMGPQSELIRTQHRPPWLKPQPGQQGRKSVLPQILAYASQPKLVFGNKKFRLKLTTLAPAITSTEFFRLISSAHSPIKIDLNKLNLSNEETDGSRTKVLSLSSDQHPLFVNEPNNPPIQMMDPLQTNPASKVESEPSAERRASFVQPTNVPSRASTAALDRQSGSLEMPSLSSRSAAREHGNQSRGSAQRDPFGLRNFTMVGHEPSASWLLANKVNEQSIHSSGRVLSPEILVKDEGELYVNGSDPSGSPLSDEELDGRRHVINYTIDANHTAFRRPVTIIRHSPRRRHNSTRASSTTTTETPDFITVPSRIRITQSSPPRLTPQASRAPAIEGSTVASLNLDGPTRPPVSSSSSSNSSSIGSSTPASDILPLAQVVRLISKQKHKYDDNVTSPPLTVIDNDAFRLPPNTTAVHNNRLLVRTKPGQFAPARFQVTTEYPYYNPVAGITPPYPSGQQTTTHRPQRPASVTGPNFGLVRPAVNVSELRPASQNHSTFGAPNIKFPAHPGGLTGNEPPSADSVAVIPNKLNVSVAEDANLVGPNRVPDKLTVDAGEQLTDGSSASATIISDATLVGRPPYGQTTFVKPNGIVRLSTTRRPNRFTTTKRINIVSANTTVITTNPDELHDVLINSIAGSHQQGHHVLQRPPRPERPGLLASIGKIFNASVATTAIALMTLIKTILVALLVMFLPPIALTAAIVQAVSMAG